MVAYAKDDITMIVLSHKRIDFVGESLNDYEEVTRAKMNQEKSGGLRLGTWKSRLMLSDRWTG